MTFKEGKTHPFDSDGALETVDAKIIDELNEFHDCLKSLQREQDRISIQMKLKDQEI